MDELYGNLAIAIVEKAMSDYRREIKKSIKSGAKTRIAFKLEEFFMSKSYGDIICMGRGEFIMNRIQSEFPEYAIIEKK